MLHKFISDVITCAAGAVVARVAPEPSLPMTPEPELVLAVTEGGRTHQIVWFSSRLGSNIAHK